jgi:mycothiol synthase
MGIEIVEIDATAAPEVSLLEMHEFFVAQDAEVYPDDPAMPPAQRLASWRNIPDHRTVRWWLLREAGEIVAAASVSMDEIDNRDVGLARFNVRSYRRRRGHATRLVKPVLDALEESGRSSIIIDSPEGSPWESKLAAAGMKKALVDRESRLLVENIDWDLMNEWIERASERANDYELLFVETPVPEDLLQKWCDLMLVMNTAPLEGLELEDFSMSPEKWRDIERSDLAQGGHLEGFIAVHEPTGAWVGLSEIFFLDHQPDRAYQGDTGVDPAHRNKGLGRWLKAVSIKSFLDRHPDVVRIDTENAGSNEPMLNINIEMGYEPLHVNYAWQGDVVTVRERLGI